MNKLIFCLVIFFGINAALKSQSTDPAGCVFQGSLYSDSSEVIIGLPFVLFIRDNDTSGCQLYVQYSTQTGNPYPVKPSTIIRLLDDYNDIIDQGASGLVPFLQNGVNFSVNRDWVEAVYEGSGGRAMIVIRDGRTRFLTDESYAIIRARFIVCPPTLPPSYLINAENGLYVANDTTVRMGGFLIENTSITTEGYNWQMKDTLSSVEFGLDYLTPETLDTTVYWARRHGSLRQIVQLGRQYYYNSMRDTTGGLYSDFTHSWNNGDPFLQYQIFNPLDVNSGTAWFKIQKDNAFLVMSNETTNPYYTPGLSITNNNINIGVNESGSGDPGNGVGMGAYGFGITEYLYMITKAVDNGTATNGQYLQLIDNSSGEVDFVTIDLSAYLPIADTAAMLDPYIQGAGTTNNLVKFTGSRVVGNAAITENGSRVVMGLPMQLKEYSLVGLPTGVTKDMYWITGAGPGWYQGARVAYALESSASTFTSGSLIFAGSTGQATQNNASLFWTNASTTLNVATSLSTSVDMLKLQGGRNAVANILFNVNDFESTISGHLMRLKSTQGTAPSIYLANNQITAAFTTASASNNINLRATTLVGGNFGFFLVAGTERKHYVMQPDVSYTGGYDEGVNFATYDHQNQQATLDKGQVQFKMAPSKENWIGDGSVNNNYNFYVTQPTKGYGRITTTSGNATIVGFNSITLFTNDFNIGTSITINSTTFTITGVTNAYTATVTPTPGFSGTYDYTINNSTPIRLGVYKNGGVEINQATGQTRYELQVTGTSGIGLSRGPTAQRPTIVTATTPLRYNTDLSLLEYGTAPSTWTPITLGSVTSVGLSLPSIFSVSGSPVTTAGTLSATFTGGNTGQFLRGDGSWSNKIVKEAGDSVIFNAPGFAGGSNAPMLIYGNDGAGYESYHERSDYGYTYNYVYTDGFNDESRIYLGSARGTISAPESLIKEDRIGGVYFHAYGNSQFNKTAVIRAEVDSIYSGDKPMAKIIFGVDENNNSEVSSNWRFIIKNDRNVSVLDHVIGSNLGVGLATGEIALIDARFHVKGTGTTTGKTMLLEDSGGADIFTVTDNKLIQAHRYGDGTSTAAALGLTAPTHVAGFVPSGGSKGTIVDYPISSFTDGNGIYTGSGTLVSHTTRALVPSTGNLFFSQLFNSSADSAYFYFVNAGGGERYVGLGITDTVSTGGASLLFGNDGTGEMSFELKTIDAVNGNTQIRGVGGDLLMSSSAGDISLSAQTTNEVRVTGLVRAKQEAYYEITSTSSPQTFSNDYSDNYVNQGSTQASFTFDFPPSPEDGQILMITWGNAISTVTLNGNGNTITGTAVTTATAGTRRMFKFYGSSNEWVKIF